MPITSSRSKKFIQAYQKLSTAVVLLEDQNLEWSSDFEAIREPLAKWLRYQTPMGDYATPYALEIADRLTEEEFDLTI